MSSELQEKSCLAGEEELSSKYVKIFCKRATPFKDVMLEMDFINVKRCARGMHAYLYAWIESYKMQPDRDEQSSVISGIKKGFMPMLENACSAAVKDTKYINSITSTFGIPACQIPKEVQFYLSSKSRNNRCILAERLILSLLSKTYSVSSILVESDQSNTNVKVMFFFSPTDAEEQAITSRNVVMLSRTHNNICHLICHKEGKDLLQSGATVHAHCSSQNDSNSYGKTRYVQNEAYDGSLHVRNGVVPPFIDSFLQACQITWDAVPVSVLFKQYCSYVVSTKQMVSGLEDIAKRQRSFELYIALVYTEINSQRQMACTRHQISFGESSTSLPSDATGPVKRDKGCTVRIPIHLSDIQLLKENRTGFRSGYNISISVGSQPSLQPEHFRDPVAFFDNIILDGGPRNTEATFPVARVFHSKTIGFCAIATRDIEKGKIVCEYAGCLTTIGDFFLPESIYKGKSDDYPEAEYDGIEDGMVWDPYTLVEGDTVRQITVKENVGVWLNSRNSQKQKRSKARPILKGLNHDYPNCKVALCVHRGIKRLYVQTLCDIPRTYELIQDYNSYWWS